MNETILITVGTTQFDSLIEYTDSQQFIDIIKSCGYKQQNVTYQYGSTGKYLPRHTNKFTLSNQINQIYAKHHVIITHGGAGTLLASLHDPYPNKKIIAIANTTLQGNHQTELITKLNQKQYILGFNSIEQFKCGTEQLKKVLKGERRLRKYPKGSGCILNKLIFNDMI